MFVLLVNFSNGNNAKLVGVFDTAAKRYEAKLAVEASRNPAIRGIWFTELDGVDMNVPDLGWCT